MEPTPTNASQRNMMMLKMIIAILATALVVGGGVYLWQQSGRNTQTNIDQTNQNVNTTNDAGNINNTNTIKTMHFSVFFQHPDNNTNEQDCGNVDGVNRTAPTPEDETTAAFAQEALNQLFAGPTTREQAEGYTSLFSEGSANMLKQVTIQDYTAYVDLNDIRTILPNANASCASQEFFASTDLTLKQFSGVQKVIYAINEDPTAFYEWMQIGCTPDNNNCDASVFTNQTGENQQATVNLYLIAQEDNGQSGEKIGCGDSSIAVETTITSTVPTITAALEKLLSLKDQFYGKSGLYNALYQSNLKVDRVAIEGEKAIVHLSGTLIQGGECDSPRVKAQLEDTALQFENIKEVEIFMNDEPLDEVLSLK
ncbi:MAG: GerMN domain-containing protein [Candidatus Kerfeldbacteria bacterium]|nr:GerMN domain-containing protein [Candidatus Kerfeldbacteria bacterium]